MNKKILSMAVAAAVAAPMAAQAEVKVSGSLQRSMTSTGGTLAGGDAGTSKINFDFGSGDVFARAAWDIRQNYGASSTTRVVTYTASGATTTTSGAVTVSGSLLAGSITSTSPLVQREQYVGVKVGGAKVMLGRQANLASKVIYGADTLNATFLEARGKSGGTGKVASFDSGMLGVSMKTGDVSFGIAYGGAYEDAGAAQNPVQASASFKAGPATVAVGYDQDAAGSDATTALSAKMKFGDVAVNALYENDNGDSIVFVDASMPMGGMTVDLGVGSNTTDSTTFTRVGVIKKIGSGKVFAGASMPDGGDTTVGVGIRVDM